MSCCGQARQAASTPAPSAGPLVNVEYRGRPAVDIRGPSGREYAFSREHPIQSVDPRDARVMLRSPAFRLL